MGKRFLEAPIRTILNNYRPVQKFIIFCFYIYSSVEKSSDKNFTTYPYITHHKGVVACRIIILLIAGFCSKIKFFKKRKKYSSDCLQ